jgi:CRP/FNR family transcriptional regulator
MLGSAGRHGLDRDQLPARLHELAASASAAYHPRNAFTVPGQRVNQTVRRIRSSPVADDGDAVTFCSTCAFSQACLSQGFDKSALGELHVLVEHVGPYAEGQHVFREGDEFTAIAAVRAGTVKTYVLDPSGHEQVLGFFLPGEVIGLNAIHHTRYPCNAVALDTVTLCRFSFPKMALLATKLPGLQQQLFRLLSQDIGKAALLAGDYSADERMAAFVLSLSRRYAQRGFSPHQYHLTMARTDMANYLRLAPETVSRVLRRFQDEGLLRIERRELEICDMSALEALAKSVLRE